MFFEKASKGRKTVVITGANGFIGRIAYHVLAKHYHVLLVDKHSGEDEKNRFGIEKADSFGFTIPEDNIALIDLENNKDRFREFLENNHADVVLHLAGLLENQEPEDILRINYIINENVLTVCDDLGINVAAASTIMLYYGIAMENEKIKGIMRGEDIILAEEEKLSTDTPYHNDFDNIKKFREESAQANFAYIQSKETWKCYASTVQK